MNPMVQTLRKLVEGYLTMNAPDPSRWVLYAPQDRVQKWWELQFSNIAHSEEWEVLQYYLLHMPTRTTLQILAKSSDTGKSLIELHYSLLDGLFIQVEAMERRTISIGNLAEVIAENIPSSHPLAFASLRDLVAHAVRDDITKRHHELGGEAVTRAGRLRKALTTSPQMDTAEAHAVTAAQE